MTLGTNQIVYMEICNVLIIHTGNPVPLIGFIAWRGLCHPIVGVDAEIILSFVFLFLRLRFTINFHLNLYLETCLVQFHPFQNLYLPWQNQTVHKIFFFCLCVTGI